MDWGGESNLKRCGSFDWPWKSALLCCVLGCDGVPALLVGALAGTSRAPLVMAALLFSDGVLIISLFAAFCHRLKALWHLSFT